ncbi:nickel pincer cofactor biosynthesis protein LarC [uncultured Desulfuromusa sp.]|uniref:nickel pincer cofactor biosynthesis protein LarC n=1 Tax=uncultured Desulfuromusa sp. TaxID=219183 RepID=UPI002AA6D254|nr:nickel pincer cofactor biosynthesis protein LarC [uncultured Desulfuromusa sp.]
MKTLYLDAFSGISGDMVLGLLLDLGVEQQTLERELAKLPISGYTLEVGREQRHGIEGTRLQVQCEETHHHRSWSTIDTMLSASELQTPVKQMSRNFFRRLGEAEAKVHGIDINRVHFHEVGAVDAIVDLVGAAIGLQLLGIDKIFCSPLPLSRGMSHCAHGALPLPAPATLEILRGKPTCDSYNDKELVTPTGATIAASAEFSPLPALPLGKTGYGVGGWELEDRPNLLRGILYEDDGSLHKPHRVQVLETNIDDSTPEQLGNLMDLLLSAGALDVSYTTLHMKKNRPGQLLTVICRPELASPLARLVMRESSSIGVRSTACDRYQLNRHQAKVMTEFGEAGVKVIYEGSRFLRFAAEYDDCRELSRKSGQPLQQIYRRVETAAYEQLDLTTKEKFDD